MIELRAKPENAQKQQPVTVCPLPNSQGRHWIGVLFTKGEQFDRDHTGFWEDISDEDKRKLSYVPDPHNTYVRVGHGTIIDTENNLKHKIDWEWMQRHPYIAPTLDKMGSMPDAVLYVYNEEEHATQVVTKTKETDRARYIIQFDLNVAQLRKVSEAMGLPASDSFTEDQLREWLLNSVSDSRDSHDNTQKFLFFAEKKNAKDTNATIFFNKLVRYGVIQTIRSLYRFGGADGLQLGATKKEVIQFLLNPENGEQVTAMKSQLLEKSGQLAEEQG